MALNPDNRWTTAVFGIILNLFLVAPVQAQTAGPATAASAPQALWSELTVPQKIILTPLADEWDSLEPFLREEWLGIAARFSSLSPQEQRHLQGQMQKRGKPGSGEQQITQGNPPSARRPSVNERLERQAFGRRAGPLTPAARARSPAWKPDSRKPPYILPPPRNHRSVAGKGR
ncbi:MAG: DUF3106 domain-containing protein [Planctomycetota bacterium]|jgi:hypothetical protein|nr:DUF3106 domain-containing protein [Planctomycetota bacterium]